MLNWYCDLVDEGKYRAIINAIFSILIIAVILAVAMTPDSAWEKIIDGDPARLEYLEYAAKEFRAIFGGANDLLKGCGYDE